MKLGMLVSARALIIAAFASATVDCVAAAPPIEVLHGWTSGGEAAAVQVLKDALESQGFSWVDMPVAGGGGGNAQTVLRARASSGNPPTAAQVNGVAIQNWGAEGFLQSVDDVAVPGEWDDVVPGPVRAFAKVDGHWVAAPVNVHRPNWLWINAKIFADNGLQPPKTWEEFNAVAQKLKEKGITPLAYGGQGWQDETVFEDIVVGIGGPAFYKKAILELDPASLKSDTMLKVFEQYGKLRAFVDKDYPGRDWNLATSMVLSGKAALQLMGDWAKGEIVKAGLTPGKEILCVTAPGTEGTFLFNTDYFMMFKVGSDKVPGQLALAKGIMDPAFQVKFNQVKGSVPARLDVSPDAFDICAQKSMADMRASLKAGTMLGANSANTGQPPAIQNAMFDAVSQYFNSNASPADGVKRFVDAVSAAK